MHGGHSGSDEIPRTGSAAGRHSKRLTAAFALTLAYMAAEVVGAFWTGSLALLADAAHMLTDAGGLFLALMAIRLAARPATPSKTYGYMRAEILSALLNAVVLLVLTVYILYEAYQRFLKPPEVLGAPMLAVAAVGLVVNLVSMKLLSAGADESLNVKGAYFEVFSDMLGSVGVIVAAIVVMATGWQLIDPIVGAGIGLFIVPRTWKLLNQVLHILLEGAPAEVDMDKLRESLVGIPGVRTVHDLHVWTITSGFDSLSGHVVVDNMGEAARILRAARKILKEDYRIEHVTVQIEDEELRREEGEVVI